MTNKEKLQLKELLITWFKETNFDNRDVWSKNEIANLMKTELSRMSHWKDKKRGNPRKGWQARADNFYGNNRE